MRREPGWIIPISILLIAVMIAFGVFAILSSESGPSVEPPQSSDSDTEPLTDPGTVRQTDPVTDPETDPITEPVTEPQTDPVSESQTTEPTTEPPESSWTNIPTLAIPETWYAVPTVTPECSVEDPTHVAVIKRVGCVEHRAFNDFYNAGFSCTVEYELSDDVPYGRLIAAVFDGYETEDTYYVKPDSSVTLRVSIAHGEENMSDYIKEVFYLTFDDGHSIYTPQTLEILAKYNIKATFFVTGKRVKLYPEYLQMTYEQGHAIGCHSYYHEYLDLYEDNDSFLGEIRMWEEEVYTALGGMFPWRLFRFPGGSNTGYIGKEKLPIFHASLTEIGYVAYDWSCSNNDEWFVTKDEDQSMQDWLMTSFVANLRAIESSSKPRICLMHETRPETCETLEWTINHAIDQGYTFRTLEDLEEYMFK